ncbi:MAG: hypothetical protein PHD72_02485 [Patescibacteria group bacterium]|nr:hypothetical protein [Patescibacteria group bacterium]
MNKLCYFCFHDEESIFLFLQKIENYTSVVRSIVLDILVIAVIIFCLFYYLPKNFKNWNLRKKYKYSDNFRLSRCLDDEGDKGRNKVYLLNEEDKTYKHIENPKTLNEVFKINDFKNPSREDSECFSKIEYANGGNIVIDENAISVANTINLLNLLSVLK